MKERTEKKNILILKKKQQKKNQTNKQTNKQTKVS
jgi:hypothetical protein